MTAQFGVVIGWKKYPLLKLTYNSHYGNKVLAMFSVHLLVLSNWKVNIAENPITIMGL